MVKILKPGDYKVSNSMHKIKHSMFKGLTVKVHHYALVECRQAQTEDFHFRIKINTASTEES